MSSSPGQAHRKLAAIVGMLGSAHDGERATAAAMATAELQRLGLTWAQLVERAFPVAPEPPPRRAWEESGFRQAAQSATPQGDFFGQRPFTQDGWEPQRPWDRPRRKPAPRPGNTASRNGLKVWDLVRYASCRYHLLDSWEVRFVQAKLEIGPHVTASEAEWRSLFRVAEKLGVRELSPE